MSATLAIKPKSYIHYDSLSYPPFTKDVLEEDSCLPTDIDYLEKELGISREKAIYALTHCRRNYGEEVKLVQKAKLFCYNLKYDLKFKAPEKGIESIFGIQSLADSDIWSETGRPTFISNTASQHYGVETLEEIIGKSIGVFRRYKDESGNYETPYKYYLQKAKLVGLEYTYCLNMATAKVETEKGVEPVNITRVCIDWEA
tara:strand:+ start:72 stop:674 length:603 start_codon:yes stop_codon:yes gene_type:complete